MAINVYSRLGLLHLLCLVVFVFVVVGGGGVDEAVSRGTNNDAVLKTVAGSPMVATCETDFATPWSKKPSARRIKVTPQDC